MGKLLKGEKYGFYFLSNTGIRYEILEGMAVGAAERFTSDIIFIMLEDCNYNVDNHVVGWLFGASDLVDGHEHEYESSINDIVEDFEKRNNLSRDIAFCATGGGIDVAYIPLSGGNILVVDSESFEVDGSFTVYRGIDDDGIIIYYDELTYPENVIHYGSKEEIEDGSSEYVEAYKQAIAFFDGKHRYTC